MTLMHGTHNDITQYPTLFGIINDFHNVAIVSFLGQVRHDQVRHDDDKFVMTS